LFNARAYRDGSAAAPRRPDTSCWVLGCSGLVREHGGPRASCTGRGASETGHHVCRVPRDGHRSQRHRESAIHFSCVPAGPGGGSCPRVLRSCPGPGAGSSPAHLGSKWRLRPNSARRGEITTKTQKLRPALSVNTQPSHVLPLAHALRSYLRRV
jgi:hypothetical protein